MSIDRRIKEIEEKVISDDAPDADEWSVEWHDAVPEKRPKGMAYDPETATIIYDGWEAQQEFRAALNGGEADLAAFLAGYGAGKSVTGARWLITQAVRNPGSRFLAMGVTFTKARDTTFNALFSNLPGDRTEIITSTFNGPENSPLVTDYNRSEHRLTLVNDSVITLGSADKWNRYAGAEYGGIWMDEPSHYGDELFDLLEMMGSRLRGVDGPKVMAMTLTGNGYNAAYGILQKRRDVIGEPLGIKIKMIRASTLDNPYIDDATKEQYKRQFAESGREEQALHGGFAAAQGLVYSKFSRDKHVILDADARDLAEDDWRIYGYDAGWKDPRVLLEVGRTPAGQYIILDAFYRSESHVSDAIDWLNADGRPEGTIVCEHTPSDIDRFQNAGFRAVKAKKDIVSGIADVRHRLEEDDHFEANDPQPETSSTVFDVPAWTPGGGGAPPRRRPTSQEEKDADAFENGQPAVGLLVSDACQTLIQEFLGYQEDEVGTSAAEDHCLDALRYIIHTSGTSGDGGAGVENKSRNVGSSVWYDPY